MTASVGGVPPTNPIPPAVIAAGLRESLLVTVMVALRAPATDGRKVTPMAQVPPGATVEQVLLAMVNSDGLLLTAPDTVMAVPPVLVIVSV